MEFDELVEHLADLTELARSEGFVAFAGQLLNFSVNVRYNRGAFDVRVAPGGERHIDVATDGELARPSQPTEPPASIND